MGINLLAGLANALQGQQQQPNLNSLTGIMGGATTNPTANVLASLIQPRATAPAGIFGNGSPTGNRGEDKSLKENEAWEEADKFLNDVNRQRKLRGLQPIDGSTYVNYRMNGKSREDIIVIK